MDKMIIDFYDYIINNQYNLRFTSEQYNWSLEDQIQEAISLKRNGRYSLSVETYIKIMKDTKIIQSAILFYMYKSIASSGHILEAFSILGLSNYIMHIKNRYVRTGQDDHTDILVRSYQSEYALTGYLKSISGDPYYTLPIPHSTIMRAFGSSVDYTLARKAKEIQSIIDNKNRY